MEDWKKELEPKAIEYLKNTVVSAFEKIKEIVERSKRDMDISSGEKHISLKWSGEGKKNLFYTIRVAERPPQGNYPSGFVSISAEERIEDSTDSVGTTKRNLLLKPFEYGKPYSISDVSEDDIVSHFKKAFKFELREVLFGD